MNRYSTRVTKLERAFKASRPKINIAEVILAARDRKRRADPIEIATTHAEWKAREPALSASALGRRIIKARQAIMDTDLTDLSDVLSCENERHLHVAGAKCTTGSE
jgi:hypothetical protein